MGQGTFRICLLGTSVELIYIMKLEMDDIFAQNTSSKLWSNFSAKQGNI